MRLSLFSRSKICAWIIGVVFALFASGLLPVTAHAQSLSLKVTISPNPVRQGELLIYNYTIGNEGPSILTNIVLTDVFPDYVTVISADGGACGPSCEAGETITWDTHDLGDLAPG